MPPETVRATPELVGFFNTYENNSSALDQVLKTNGGYKVLVKYYIRTGLRASQAVCRNYLLNLEERSEYLEFLKKEIGVAAALSTAVLALVNANATLSQSFLIARTGIDGGIDAYEEYRFLNIDREAARAVVEAAQNALAQHFLKQVDSGSADSNLVTGGYTFSDALHAVSMIEYQCTRSGIRSLLTRSINNTPSNLAVDEATGTLIFRSTKGDTIIDDVPPSVRKVIVPPPPPAAAGSSPVVVAKPPGSPQVSDTGPVVTPAGKTCSATKPNDDAAQGLIDFLRPTPAGVLRKSRKDQLVGLNADLVAALMADAELTQVPAKQKQLTDRAKQLATSPEVIVFGKGSLDATLRKKLSTVLNDAVSSKRLTPTVE